MGKTSKMAAGSTSVFFYVPNLIGYLRLLLILLTWLLFERVYWFLPLYTLQMCLDGIDGCLARRLKQCSTFGAWLDVLADNIGRSVVWVMVFKGGVFISCLEWTVFVCTHSIGSGWKNTAGIELPNIVKRIMRNGFYNPLGGYVILGIHVLPLSLYMYQYSSTIPYLNEYGNIIPLMAVLLLVPGRILGMIAELSYIGLHILNMVNSDDKKDSEDEGKMATGGDIPP